jgi:Domain of unknown function (DUF4260)
MKIILQLEELAIFLCSILAFSTLPFAWWWFPVLILLPDISMLGYTVNNKVGAISYNIFHHKAIALAVLVMGYYLLNDYWLLTGIILFGHSAMDRCMGYGLKYFKGFSFTHLGSIGKGKEKVNAL